MHRTLARQLKRLDLGAESAPDSVQWKRFTRLVDGTYKGSDQDRYLLERSLEISSKELTELNKELRIASEQANAANEAKSQFLANMSHELRTPLNAIIGFSELIMEEYRNLETNEIITSLERIHSSGNHLLVLINEILDLAKIESGKMELNLETFNLKDILLEIEGISIPLVEKNHNTFKIHYENEIDNVFMDKLKVFQIMINLISNAAKFTNKGEIELSLKKIEKKGADWISLRLTDTGIGISKSQMKKIFSPFVQAHYSEHKQYGGTGLGLSIVKKICDIMGGSITCKSKLNRGSTFTLELPTMVNRKEKTLFSRRKTDKLD